MPRKSIPYVVLLGSLYGTTLIASRFSVTQYAPTTYLGFRLVIATLAASFVYVFSIQGRKWPRGRELWQHSVLLGIFGSAIPMALIVLSLQYLSSGLAAILMTLAPAFTVIMAHYGLPDEKITSQKSVGLGLALTGAVLLAVLGESGLPNIDQADPRGYILVLSAMLIGSVMIVYTRKYMTSFDPFEVSSIRLFTAAIIVSGISYLIIGVDLSQVTSQGYFALLYAAMAGTFFGMILEFYNIKHFGATTAVMSVYIIPIVASLGGMLLLGEKITPGMIIGMLLIFIGIGTLNQKGSKQELSPPLEHHV